MTPPVELFRGLFDDAAIFPPGNAELAEAVRAHLAHRDAVHADLVGPLVVGCTDLEDLDVDTAGVAPGTVELSVTAPSPDAAAHALVTVAGIRAARLVAVELVLPADLPADQVLASLQATVGEPEGVLVFVELPRDARRPALIEELSGSPYLAKLRTGGVRAAFYPDETELATGICALVSAGVPFKATAGLHHAVRNTDPVTGFEQHGFLNVLAATDAALAGADPDEVTGWLAQRDERRVAERVAGLPPRTRAAFRSFGTCSIDEPVAELVSLRLLEPTAEVLR